MGLGWVSGLRLLGNHLWVRLIHLMISKVRLLGNHLWVWLSHIDRGHLRVPHLCLVALRLGKCGLLIAKGGSIISHLLKLLRLWLPTGWLLLCGRLRWACGSSECRCWWCVMRG